MKILNLRFKNLNSLYGEWCIDFTDPEYVSNGIFAITGPTGVGKSTILDAVCLALYGMTPRLKKITKSSNEIMSRQTGECFAEVIFESQAGRFRCHWSQHRARKKMEGNLTESRHEISDAMTGDLLESKKSHVAKKVEEKTGMTFDRFTRSILLAQGDFARFLEASSDERAPVLEQITGSEIYSELSKKVHERQRSEQEKLTLFQAELRGITILNDDEEAHLVQELEEKKAKEQIRKEKYQKYMKAVHWRKGINALEKELIELSTSEAENTKALEAFRPNKEKLNSAIRAAELDVDFTTLTIARTQMKSNIAWLQENQIKIPELKKVFIKIDQKFDDTVAKLKNAKEIQSNQQPVIKKVRALDLQLKEKQKTIDTLVAELNQSTQQLNDIETKLEKANVKREQTREKLKKVMVYHESNIEDGKLLHEIGVIRQNTVSLTSLSNNISQRRLKLDGQEKKLQQLAKDFTKQEKALEKHNIHLKKAQKEVKDKKDIYVKHLDGRILREYRTEKESLLKELFYLDKIAGYESERRKLEDGKSCPLCGSEHHPYAKGNIPQRSSLDQKVDHLTALIQRAEEFEKAIESLEKNEKVSIEILAEKKQKAIALEGEKSIAENQLQADTLELKIQLTEENEIRSKLEIQLKSFGIEDLQEKKIPDIIKDLEKRLELWNSSQKEKDSLWEQGVKLKADMQSLNDSITAQKEIQENRHMKLEVLNKEFGTQKDERVSIFGIKDPDEEERRTGDEILSLETGLAGERGEKEQAKQFLERLKSDIKNMSDKIQLEEPTLKELEDGFKGKLKEKNFANENSFLSCRMDTEERDSLQAKSQLLEDQQKSISTRIQERKAKLQIENEKKITELKLKDIELIVKELEGQLKLDGEAIGALKQKLTDNELAKAKVKKQRELIEKQQSEQQKWGKLHMLIGSADGKNFRNFAQGLTFELMVSHANKQLEKMTDRYLLVRDNEEPLELNVVDKYQAGETRTTKNLSGGESFIVSLALALGLSKMASRKVRVDSLFLDEGFGTLDEDALETALETLSSLQQDNKLIGIISHVPALKERISTQINVQSRSGGRSIITGPGCGKKNERAS